MLGNNINYKFNNLNEAKSLSDILDKKLETLRRLIGKNSVIKGDIEFNKEGSHKHGKVFKVEAKLNIDGNIYRATATENSFEEALDEVRDELDKELRRDKDKQHSVEKKQARNFKDKLSSL